MKKFVSVILSFVLLFGCLSVLSAGAENAAEKVPTIYIVGGNQVMRDPETGEQKWKITVPDGYIGEAAEDCIDDFLKAVVTGRKADIETYKTKLLSWVAPLYADVICDENGVPLNELTVCRDYNVDRPFELGDSIDDRIYNGYYPIRAYDFYYDWRADLFLAADELEHYIDMICEATGSEQVNLMGRCEGASLILAYLASYGSDRISRMMLYTPTSEEYMLASQTFAGKIEFSFPEISTWVDHNRYFSLDSLPIDSNLIELLDATLRLAAESRLGLSQAALNRMYNRIFKSILPDILLASYATMPATWSMVSDEDFETAMSFVFGGKEAQYAGLIERIRTYHDTAGVVSDALLTEAAENGVHIGVITKYGYPAMPLFEESALLTDGSCLIRYSSFGATASTYDGTLSDSYIVSRWEAGKSAYISPDKKIDASTCLFPDTTWFVGGIDHDNFPWCIDLFVEGFMLSQEPMTVHSDGNRPQFMLYENGEIVPMTAENADRSTVSEPKQASSGSVFLRFLRSLGNVLRNYLRSFFFDLIDRVKGTA